MPSEPAPTRRSWTSIAPPEKPTASAPQNSHCLEQQPLPQEVGRTGRAHRLASALRLKSLRAEVLLPDGARQIVAQPVAPAREYARARWPVRPVELPLADRTSAGG